MSYNEPTWSALVALGLDPTRHLPVEGAAPVTFHGYTVWVMPKAEAVEKGITQRTRALCPHCGKQVAHGNLRQHMYGNRRRVPGALRTLGRQLGVHRRTRAGLI